MKSALPRLWWSHDSSKTMLFFKTFGIEDLTSFFQITHKNLESPPKSASKLTPFIALGWWTTWKSANKSPNIHIHHHLGSNVDISSSWETMETTMSSTMAVPKLWSETKNHVVIVYMARKSWIDKSVIKSPEETQTCPTRTNDPWI